MNPVFSAIIKSNKVVFHNVDLFNGYLISLEGKDVDVVVRKKKKIRSNPQNAFYWGVCVKLLCETTGYTDDEMHHALKMLFLQDRSRKIPTLRSTTNLTTMEFESYLEQIRVWASTELSCVIPMPNEVMTDTEIIREPTRKEVKEHQTQVEKEFEENKTKPVDKKTLDEIFGWTEKGITQDRIMEICRENFNGKEPRELTQTEAEQLDTLIVTELCP